jgi:hypothetical protein
VAEWSDRQWEDSGRIEFETLSGDAVVGTGGGVKPLLHWVGFDVTASKFEEKWPIGASGVAGSVLTKGDVSCEQGCSDRRRAGSSQVFFA